MLTLLLPIIPPVTMFKVFSRYLFFAAKSLFFFFFFDSSSQISIVLLLTGLKRTTNNCLEMGTEQKDCIRTHCALSWQTTILSLGHVSILKVKYGGKQWKYFVKETKIILFKNKRKWYKNTSGGDKKQNVNYFNIYFWKCHHFVFN